MGQSGDIWTISLGYKVSEQYDLVGYYLSDPIEDARSKTRMFAPYYGILRGDGHGYGGRLPNSLPQQGL